MLLDHNSDNLVLIICSRETPSEDNDEIFTGLSAGAVYDVSVWSVVGNDIRSDAANVLLATSKTQFDSGV